MRCATSSHPTAPTDSAWRVDVYHVWWDPLLQREIMRAGERDRLYAYHICDWLVPTRDLLNDRGMMGDGVIDLPLIRCVDGERPAIAACTRSRSSRRENWWKRDADEVLLTCRHRHAERT